MKIKLNDDLGDCFISRARVQINHEEIAGDYFNSTKTKPKFSYKKILRIPEREECVLLEDIIPIINKIKKGKMLSNKESELDVFIYIGGGVYYYNESYHVSNYEIDKNYIRVGCQFISKFIIKSLNLK